MLVIKKLRNILSDMVVRSTLKVILLVGTILFLQGINTMARADVLKFNRGQIIDRVFDEDAKAIYMYEMGIAIANGDIPNMSVIDKFGANDNVDQSQDNDIWDLGGTYQFLSEPTALTLSSATSTDDSADTGARTVKVFTLDSAWALASKTATMNGLSAVTLGTHRRVYRAFVETAGSNNGANATLYVGYSTLTAGVPAQKLAAVLPVNNQTLMAIMTVPSGQTGYIKEWFGGFDGITGTARFGNLNLDSRVDSGVRRNRRKMGLSTSVTPYLEPHFAPIMIEEKNDVIAMVNAVSADDLSLSAGFDLILIEN